MPEAYRVEEELLGPTPRRVAKAAGRTVGMAGIGCLRIFLIPFILVGVVTLLMAIGGTLVAVAGVEMPGKVVARRDTSDSDGSSYKVDFTFHCGAAVYSGSSDVSSVNYGRLEPGSDVMVRALPWAPSILPVVRGASEHGVPDFAFFGIFALCWNGIISVFLWVAYILPGIERRLVVGGLAAAGRVTKRTTVTNEESMLYYIHCEFVTRTASDTTIASKYSVTQKQWESVAVGDTLTVLYDAQRPKRSTLYRFAAYRALE